MLINNQLLQFFSISLMMVIISCLSLSQCPPTMAQKIVMAAGLVVLMHLEWVLVFQSALVAESILNTWMETSRGGMLLLLLLYQVLKLYEIIFFLFFIEQGWVVQSWFKITQDKCEMWFQNENGVFSFLSGIWLLDAVKNNWENYLEKAFEQRNKETWCKT